MTTPAAAKSPTDVINPLAGMDAVTLRVGDLELMSSYYSNALALEPVEERSRGSEVHRVLGRGSTPFVRLISTPGLPGGRCPPGGTVPHRLPVGGRTGARRDRAARRPGPAGLVHRIE